MILWLIKNQSDANFKEEQKFTTKTQRPKGRHEGTQTLHKK